MSKASQSSAASHTLPRALFLGTQGVFSRTVLAALIQAHVPLCAVMVPSPTQQLSYRRRNAPLPQHGDELLLRPASSLQTTVQVAWQHNLPVFEVGRLAAPDVSALVKELAPDVACVACFSKKIPLPLLTLPTYGFLNVHPALLPAYRGPAPLFWQLRAGEQPMGVTVHWMDTDWDTGDLAAQVPLHLPDGASGAEIDLHCAQAGGALLVSVLQAMAAGQPPRTPQPSGGSYQSWPTAEAFTVETHWSAQHAFNFMRGTSEWGYAYRLEMAGKTFWLTQALAYTDEGVLSAPYQIQGAEVALQLNPGTLYAVVG
jgi:methionyl-tRNA formyltransferase